jgi:hypothetical protein
MKMFTNRLFYLLIVVALLVVTACAPQVAPISVPTSASVATKVSSATATTSAVAVESPSPTLSPTQSPAPRYTEVEFAADGGPTLRGRVWSDGRIGVVLAHGFSQATGQDDWNAFADYLAGLGYGVLTFDFRSFCDRGGCSEGPMQLGENWRDAAAAVEYMRSRGSERIFIIGASMGGLARDTAIPVDLLRG